MYDCVDRTRVPEPESCAQSIRNFDMVVGGRCVCLGSAQDCSVEHFNSFFFMIEQKHVIWTIDPGTQIHHFQPYNRVTPN